MKGFYRLNQDLQDFKICGIVEGTESRIGVTS